MAISTAIATPILITISYCAIVLVYYYLFRQKLRIRRENSIQKKFLNTLYRGVKNKQISTYDDLIHVYEGVSGLSSEEIKYRSGLNQDLKKIIVALVNCDDNILEDLKKDDDCSEVKSKIDEFIEQVTKISPFAELPSPERNVLSDIDNLVGKTNDNTEIIKAKILDLSGMIQSRHSTLKKYEESSKYMTPITISSVILTIIFGILSLI